ncbi:MAG: histidine kinase N-terminal 7TM domain-containing protein, partial [Candidatus Paceibacterales bacterium]
MFLNLDSFSVGLAIAGNLILGFIVLFARKKSATGILFFLLSLTLSAWSVVNFSSYQAQDPHLALVLVRMVMFFAVPIGTLFLLFTEVFPGDAFKVDKRFTAILILYSVMAMILTLTSAVFQNVTVSPGSAPVPIIGPGIIVFSIVPVLAILFGIIQLTRRTLKAGPDDKKQYRDLLMGVLIMFVLIIVFNFIFPSFLNNTRFIPLSAVFTLPFVALTAYAIFRHHLLNMKIIATEGLTFLLTAAMAAEIIFSTDLAMVIFRFSVLLLVLGVGILLIKSVRREVEQREQLEILTKQLADANNKLQILDQARAEFITIASHQLRT